MYAPESACKALFRLHPQLRIGWVGKEKKHEDDLNAGSFGIAQLYHIQDAGTPDYPLSFREFWHVMPFLTENGDLYNARVDRGPLYNRFGGSTPDWDPLFRVPMFIMTLDEHYKYADGKPIKREDVFSGKFIEAVEHNLGGIVGRITKGRKARARELSNKAEDLGNEMGAFLWKQANKTGETFNHWVTVDERVKALARHDEQKWRRDKTFNDCFEPPPAPKGAK